MKMRDRKRRLAPILLGRAIFMGQQREWADLHERLASELSDLLVFPPPAAEWGEVIGFFVPFLPLPARRDIRYERRLARMRDRIGAALVITEE